MEREEIKKYLPHREPMLLVDDAVLNEDGSVTAHYTVRGDEFFLQGHFPDYPVVPGVILCEILAQSSFLLVLDEKIEDCLTLYTGISNVKFRNQVRPKDTLTITSRLTRVKRPFYFISGEIKVGDKLCLTEDFSIALVPKNKG